MGISKKLLIFFITLTIATIMLVFSFTFYTTQSEIEDKFGYLLNEMVNKTVMHMDSKVLEIERSMNMLVMNSEFTSNYMNLDKIPVDEYVRRTAQAKALADITIYSSKDIESIIIKLKSDEDLHHYGGNFSDQYYVEKEYKDKYAFFFMDWDNFSQEIVIENILQNYHSFYWTSGIQENYDDIYLMKKLSHWDTGKQLGIITMVMDMEVFTDLYLDMEKEFSSTNYLVDSTGTIVAHSNPELIGTTLDAEMERMINLGDSSEYYNVDGHLIAFQEAKNGWVYISSIPMEYITREIDNAWTSSFLIIIIGILLATLVFFIYTRRISRNMGILISKMLKVEEGDMEISEKIESNDEIGLIDNYFNRMVEKLNRLIRKNYVQKLEKREAELSALQFQINPHFLYNTLESISAIGSVYGSHEISQISQKLGQMLRYSININSSEFVTLTKEIQHIENYFFIQEVRFEDRFKVFYDIDPHVKDAKVLKLILQPIVENIIQHGLSDEDEGIIAIVAEWCDKNLIIKISDDGKGMSNEQVKQLNDYINEDTDKILTGYKKSVGMRNVNLRIKLAYGEEYGLHVTSQEGIGTHVTFTLPLI
ncbi:sensor histidine kinase [Vallitalea okinawensis]|uniref:sensor histidine kinase n=1 Tax=Vallitalea okinawensis TaxID=2078660 RepID=UPI000CFAB2C2|nr:sensor histidine kinase [Vallitalea okinawensis]